MNNLVFKSYARHVAVLRRKCPQESATCVIFFSTNRSFVLYWAIPGGTAIPGRPVARAEQAPGISPVSKNQFNIVVARKPRIRY